MASLLTPEQDGYLQSLDGTILEDATNAFILEWVPAKHYIQTKSAGGTKSTGKSGSRIKIKQDALSTYKTFDLTNTPEGIGSMIVGDSTHGFRMIITTRAVVEQDNDLNSIDDAFHVSGAVITIPSVKPTPPPSSVGPVAPPPKDDATLIKESIADLGLILKDIQDDAKRVGLIEPVEFEKLINQTTTDAELDLLKAQADRFFGLKNGISPETYKVYITAIDKKRFGRGVKTGKTKTRPITRQNKPPRRIEHLNT